MFSAEELEDWDIFPKKITTQAALKFSAYFFFFSFALILVYSFYSGENFISIITLEMSKYNSNDPYLQKVSLLDHRFNYDKGANGYNIKMAGIDEIKFYKDYVLESLPVIIKGETISEKISDGIFSNLSRDLFWSKFLNDTTKILTLMSNEFDFPFNILKFATAYSTDYISIEQEKGMMERSENFLCVNKGSVDLMLVPALDRDNIYSYKDQPNRSPVDFFKADYSRFPNFKQANRLFITISANDCLYLPAFWWHGMRNEKESEELLIYKLTFEPHSQWVDEISRAISTNNFK
jgi:hypothetical protein